MGHLENKTEKQIEGICFGNLAESYNMGYQDCLKDMSEFINKNLKMKMNNVEVFIKNEYKDSKV